MDGWNDTLLSFTGLDSTFDFWYYRMRFLVQSSHKGLPMVAIQPGGSPKCCFIYFYIKEEFWNTSRHRNIIGKYDLRKPAVSGRNRF